MSDITELLLKKYYGFGADPDNKKFLSSHEATYDPSKFYQKSDSTETTEAIEEATGQGTSSEATKDKVENSNKSGVTIGNGIVRSSRAIPDDDIPDEEGSDINEYVEFLESTTPRGKNTTDEDNNISVAKNPSILKIEKYDDTRELFNRNDSVREENFDDFVSENASDISFVPTRKKPKKKSALTATSTISSQLAQPPKKLPSCNGIFLDLTKHSLAEFPVNIIANMPNLRMLYLENNSLTKLPDQLFSSLRLLQWLDVRNNRIKTLPKNIKYHPCLETILLDGNLFEELPLELCSLPSLRELQTSRNPLIFPPADILALGLAATINFLRTEWNKTHPEEIVEYPERDKKPRSSTILCSDPPILPTLSRSSRIFGSSSTGHVAEGMKKISVRQKTRNYRPSNRCENLGTDKELETRLMWIARVKEMLTKQTIALQKIKDRDALSDWRRDRRSYDKSMSRAASRTEEDIPFGIYLEDIGALFKNQLKMPLKGSKSKKREPASKININEKMTKLYESLNRLQKARNAETLSPRAEQRLLENEIKKLSDVQEEIQNLRQYNVTTTAPFEGSEFLPETQLYKPPPSIII